MEKNPFKCINMRDAAWFRNTKRKLQKQSLENENENMVARALSISGFKFSRNAQFARRFVDFYIHSVGVCIEVDGKEHDQRYDELRDLWLFKQGILVFRMKNGDTGRLDAIIHKMLLCSNARERKSQISKSFAKKWWKNDQLTAAIWERYRRILDPSRS